MVHARLSKRGRIVDTRKEAVRLALVTLVLAMAPAYAQFSGAIQGLVTDASQAVVPGVAIRLTNVETGVVRQSVTSSEGLYSVISLGPGAYRVEAEKAGFLKVVRDSAVGVNEIARVDFSLKLGAVQESVTVSDRPPAVETEQGRITAKVDRVQLEEMPLMGRNIYNIIAIQPGVTGTGLGGSAQGASNDLFAGETQPEINASGQRWEANNYTVDDTSVNAVARGGVANITPNADSVEEVRVVANNFSAVDGRNSGAQIQVITKSGTNTFHGTLSHYFANNTLSARNVFESTVPGLRKNQFNATVRGPIIKNRTFFLFSYEGMRKSGGRALTGVVETLELRDYVLHQRPNSIAAKLLDGFRPMAYPTFAFSDIGSPKAGANQIGPRDGIADLGSVAYVPATTRSGQQWSVRIDHELRPGKDRLYGNVYRTKAHTLNGGLRPAFNRPLDETTVFGNLNETHIFGPSMINEFRGGVSRLLGRPAIPAHLEVPAITVTSATGFGVSVYPQAWPHTNYHYKDIFSWMHGSHTIKFGGELRRMIGNARTTTYYIPGYTFANILDFADDEAIDMRRSVDPRTGLPSMADSSTRNYEWALFVNDDWKVTRNLTVNIGLRYENYGNLTEQQGRQRGIVFGAGDTYSARLAAGKVDFVPHFYPTDWLNFAPRFGFAWNPGGKGKTSVRGGWGIAYDRMTTLPLERFEYSPPIRALVTLGLLYGTQFTYSLGDPSKPSLGYPIDPALQVGLDERNGVKGARVAVVTVDPNQKSPYTYNWFLGVQRDLGARVTVEASYLGSAAHHLINSRDVNRSAGDLLDSRFDGINPSFNNIYMLESTSNSSYHGGTISVRRRFGRGFTAQGAFTCGKAIDDTDVAVNYVNWQDTNDRRAERALAGYHVPRRISAMGLWDLPFLKGRRGLIHSLLGGWKAGGFVILEAGRPITPTVGGIWPRGDYNGDGTAGDRPNAPTTELQTSGWSRSDFLKGTLKAASFPVPAPGTNGNLGRNTFRGPGFAETDLTFSKRFAVTERVGAQLRVDLFNAFNRVNLNSPSMDMNSSNFGRSTSAKAPRNGQVGLRIEF